MSICCRDSKGRFVSKTDVPKNNRSIRVTDESWEIFNDVALCLGVTKGDLFQVIVMEVAVQKCKE